MRPRADGCDAPDLHQVLYIAPPCPFSPFNNVLCSSFADSGNQYEVVQSGFVDVNGNAKHQLVSVTHLPDY